ncbi:MAG TPA: hypothetical protein VGN17_05385 [Bryobacteraceae bacterium]|jgi:hypothetical protein
MEIRKKYKRGLNALLDRLKDSKTPSGGGGIGFRTPDFEFIVSVLESAVDFQPEIPEADRSGIVRQAAMATGRDPAPDEKLLERHLKTCEAEYLRKPILRYSLASSFGITGYRGQKASRLNGVDILFTPKLPKRFDRTQVQSQVQELIPNAPNDVHPSDCRSFRADPGCGV